MADNITVNGNVIATDDVGGVQHQRAKLSIGADGVAVDVSDANPIPVDDAGGSLTVDNAGLTTIAGAISGAEMQVDVVAPLPTGANTIGKVDIATALPTGANTIGKVHVVTPVAAVGSHVRNATLTAAVDIAVPAGANVIYISVEAQSIRMTLDGTTTPTDTIGLLITAGNDPKPFFVPAGGTIKIIEAVVGGIVNYQFMTI